MPAENVNMSTADQRSKRQTKTFHESVLVSIYRKARKHRAYCQNIICMRWPTIKQEKTSTQTHLTVCAKRQKGYLVYVRKYCSRCSLFLLHHMLHMVIVTRVDISMDGSSQPDRRTEIAIECWNISENDGQ